MAAIVEPPCLPEETKAAQHDAAPSFTQLPELAGSHVGGEVLFATDDWFAFCENMIATGNPVFIPGKFTDFGKWMDGWETRRKRIPGHDWAIIKLGAPGTVAGVEVSTAFFTGNHSPRVSIQAVYLPSDDAAVAARLGKTRKPCTSGIAATKEQLAAAAALKSDKWPTLVPFTPLKPGYRETHRNFFKVESDTPVTHLRVNMFPDGGIARLRVFGKTQRDWSSVGASEVVDLAAMRNGAHVLCVNDSHYGHHSNLIAPNRGVNMGDGWETRRRSDRPAVLKPNKEGLLRLDDFDWCVIRLGTAGLVREFEVDTNHFKGNAPESCIIEGADASSMTDADVVADPAALSWKPLLTRTKLRPHAQQRFRVPAAASGRRVTHLRLKIFPDGGVSRLRAFGVKAPSSRL